MIWKGSTMKREEMIVPKEKIEEQKIFIEAVKNKMGLQAMEIEHNQLAHIMTYGCQQNQADSEKLRGMLELMGYRMTESKDKADLILLNTCCVRENAETKLFGHLGSLKQFKSINPNLIICVCGCMMQQQDVAEEIKQKYPFTDLVFGTHNVYRFPELLMKSMDSKKILVEVENSEGLIVEDIPVSRTESYRAGVSIMYGCNNFCTYCIVPYVRGRERSRLPEDILKEIKELVADGCEEIMLLGQNVNSYGKDLESPYDFADLLEAVDKVEDIKRIRFMTSHPKDASDKLIEVMKNSKNICRQFHLPIQSGSNNILKAMNRYYSREDLKDLIQRIKAAMPDISLSTDIIVGFPGETEDDFEETIEMLEFAKFDLAYTFIYSPRKGTPAEKMENQIEETVKNARFQRLVEVQNRITRESNDACMGQTLEVLVEGLSRKNKSRYMGRTGSNKVVNFEGNDLKPGDIVHVRINECFTWFLNGTLVR